MKRPVIAVDIDGVLADEAEFVIAYSNEHWGHSLTMDDYRDRWSEMWGVNQAENDRRAHILHGSGIVTQYRLFGGARDVLEELAKRYKLVVLTSRWGGFQQETLDWLHENFGDVFSEVKFTGFYNTFDASRHTRTKDEILKDMEVTYLIDDQAKHCFAAVTLGVNAVLFGNNRVNRDVELPKGVVHCKDWTAVMEYFDGRDS